jgi:hypothetical protein
MQSRTMNNAISNGRRLGSWIIDRFHVQLHSITVELIEGIHPYCEGFCQLCNFISRVIFMTIA